MFRTIIAGAAVAGALTFGAAGIAGASTPATGSTPPPARPPPTRPALCAKLPAVQAKVQKVEAKVATWVPKAQAREATLKTAGKTQARRTPSPTRITRVQNRETKVNAGWPRPRPPAGRRPATSAG